MPAGGHTEGINKNNKAPAVVKTVVIGIVPGPGFYTGQPRAYLTSSAPDTRARSAACCLLVDLAPTG